MAALVLAKRETAIAQLVFDACIHTTESFVVEEI